MAKQADHCKFAGEIFQDFDCLLNFVGEKADNLNLTQLFYTGVLCFIMGFYVWTRWGRNRSVKPNKLKGRTSETNAHFKKKFQDEIKRNWIEREPGSQTLGKPEFPAAFLAEVQLPAEVFYVMMLQLPVRDILRCVQVCKVWKALLSEKFFWKIYAERHFDLGIKSDLSNEEPVSQWWDIENLVWYFTDEDVYVMRPFPSMWNCRVFHPFGLDPFSGDVKSLQGFCRSLEILTHLISETSRLRIQSGTQCSANEGQNDICVVLFPWDKKGLPTPLELLDGVFHFHPAIYEYYSSYPKDKGELRENKLFFHVRPNEYAEPERVEDDDDHDIEEKPCLNRVLGMDNYITKDKQWKFEDSRRFYEWLQPIMHPSVTIYVGEYKINPVAVFMLTPLAPGWVGGVLTGCFYT